MRASSIILAATLALNAAFGLALWRHFHGRPAGKSGAETSIAGTTRSASSRPDLPGALKSALPAAPATLWTQLDADDLDGLAARLRGAGFPPRAVRAILHGMISEREQKRREAVLGRPADAPYWKSVSSFYSSTDKKTRAQLDAINDEFQPLYRKYSSAANVMADDADAQIDARRRCGDLPVDRLTKIATIEQTYGEKASDLFRSVRDRFRDNPAAGEDPEWNKAYQALQQERDATLRQELTPDEYQQYQLRNSPTANMLRQRLEVFQPTEEEYKLIFGLYAPIAQQYTGVTDQTQADARRVAVEAMKSKLEAALGPDRYADYVQSEQSSGDKLSRLMIRLELPASTMGKIDIVRNDVTSRAAEIRDNTQLSPAEQSAQLSALADEATGKLRTTLGGDRGLQAYQDLKGDWIRALISKPPGGKR